MSNTPTHLDAASITKVHVVFKSHLDLGFTGMAADVLQQYFEHFIPSAIDTAVLLRDTYGETFTWTTGSFLIYEYLERASLSEARRLETAIANEDIAWHALPFTTHTELMDASLFKFGLSFAQRLDTRFGRKTRAGKMTDVPGHTRAMVPLLAEAGIDFLHIGVNPASAPPDVPSIFRWAHSDGSQITVAYSHADYGTLCAIPGASEVLHFAHTGDNAGPQSIEQIREELLSFRTKYPNAEVSASTLDAFAAAIRPMTDRLPTVTAEIGDTWIHGIATDPKKTSDFLRLSRWRREEELKSPAWIGTPSWHEFSKQLALVAEHTWGRDVKHLFTVDGGVEAGYQKSELEDRRARGDFSVHEASWREQRAYIDHAMAALESTTLSSDPRSILDCPIVPPELSGFELITPNETNISTSNFNVNFDPITGAINQLVDRKSHFVWATSEHPLGLFTYQVFDSIAYEKFLEAYNPNPEATNYWAIPDFGKPGLEKIGISAAVWKPTRAATYWKRELDADVFVSEMHMDAIATQQFGCPEALYLRIIFPDMSSKTNWEVSWFGKTASRVPEASWISFCPPDRTPDGWRLLKMGEEISPLDVVSGGNRTLHAVSTVSHTGSSSNLVIKPMDSALVAPGRPALVEFNRELPDLAGGMHFNLHNNVWGTNFPLYYSEDARFTFEIEFNS